MIINDVPKRLNVITNEPFVRIGLTVRNLMISSSGSRNKNYHSEYHALVYLYKTRLNHVVRIYTKTEYQNERNEIEHVSDRLLLAIKSPNQF